MDAVDVDPRSVEPQAQAVVVVARARKDPELLGLSLRVLAWDISGTVGRLVGASAARRGGAGHAGGTASGTSRPRVLASRASVLHELGDVARGAPATWTPRSPR